MGENAAGGMKPKTRTLFLCVALLCLYVARAADVDDYRSPQNLVDMPVRHAPAENGEYAARSSSDPDISSLLWSMARIFRALIPAPPLESMPPYTSSSLASTSEPGPAASPVTAVRDDFAAKEDSEAAGSKAGDSREAKTHVRQLAAPAPQEEMSFHVQPAVGAASAPSHEHALLLGLKGLTEGTAPSPAQATRLHPDFFVFPWFNSPLENAEKQLHLKTSPAAPGPMALPSDTSPEGQPAPSILATVPSSSPKPSSSATFERRWKAMKGSTSEVSSAAPALAASPISPVFTIPSKAKSSQQFGRKMMPPLTAPESSDAVSSSPYNAGSDVTQPESGFAPRQSIGTEEQYFLGGSKAGPKEAPAPAVEQLEGGALWSPTAGLEAPVAAVADASFLFTPTAAGPLPLSVPSPSTVLPPSAVPDIGPLPTVGVAEALPSAGPEPVILASGRNQDGPGYNLMKAVFALIQTKDPAPISLSDVANTQGGNSRAF